MHGVVDGSRLLAGTTVWLACLLACVFVSAHIPIPDIRARNAVTALYSAVLYCTALLYCTVLFKTLPLEIHHVVSRTSRGFRVLSLQWPTR